MENKIISLLSAVLRILLKEHRLPYRNEILSASRKIKLLIPRYKNIIFLIPYSYAIGDILVLSPIARALKKGNDSIVVYVGSRRSIDLAKRIEDFDYVINDAGFNGLENRFNLKSVIRLPLDDFKKFKKDLIEVQWEKIRSNVIDDKTIRYRLREKDENIAKDIKEKYGDYLVFAPDAGPWSKKKMWLNGRWQKLIDLQALPVVIVGTSKAPSLRHCIDLINKTTIHEMAALIKHCKLLVSLPSGPLWFARIFEKEAIVINGGYELPILTKYDKSYHFFTDLECSLCNVDPKKRCVNNMECMRKITPEIVDKKIKEMISVVEK